MNETTHRLAPKPVKVGSWRRDFAGLQERRLEAAHMFALGASQAEVARAFGVSLARPPAPGMPGGVLVGPARCAAPVGPVATPAWRRRSWTRSTKRCARAPRRSG